MGLRRSLILSVCAVAGLAVAACSNNTSAAGPGAGGGRGRGGRGGGGDAPVVTAKVAEKDVPIDITAIGNVEAFVTTSVRSQVTGLLIEVAFHEGDVVKQGQLLFNLDRRDRIEILSLASDSQSNLPGRDIQFGQRPPAHHGMSSPGTGRNRSGIRPIVHRLKFHPACAPGALAL